MSRRDSDDENKSGIRPKYPTGMDIANGFPQQVVL
jgi:hypothetical protein